MTKNNALMRKKIENSTTDNHSIKRDIHTISSMPAIPTESLTMDEPFNIRDSFMGIKEINERLTHEISGLKKSIDISKKFSSFGKRVGGLMHEINNPLDGVIRYVNLAFDSLEEVRDNIAKEYLGEARKGLRRITKIVRFFSDLSWGLSQQDGQININDSIQDCLYTFQRHIVSHGIEVRRSFASQLPHIPNHGFTLLISNIIRNACETMKEGGTLTISTELNNSTIHITCTDTGCGIPLEEQEKIFDPFFTTKNLGEGSGLGLAISSEIIERYNGTINVESEPGKGSTFIMKFPLNHHK